MSASVPVIIPAAGLGTRFLPYTKSIPKEMLPILNKPAIHYILEEGRKSGVEKFLMVVSENKKSIEDYLDKGDSLTHSLEEKGCSERIKGLNKLIKDLQICYVRQGKPLGLGHAISVAQPWISTPRVAIMLPDDIIIGKNPAIHQLIETSKQERCSVIAIREVPSEEISRYGIISPKKQLSPNLFQINDLIEKPSPSEAPSNLAIVGRYVLSNKIFDHLESAEEGHNGEIQLTDAIRRMLRSGERVFACKLQGNLFDTGTPVGWLKTILRMAIDDETYVEEIKEIINSLH